MRQAHERSRLVNRATKDIVWDWDLSTGAIQWSVNFCTLMGHPLSDMRGSEDSWRRSVHPSDRPRVLRSLRRALAGDAECWSAAYRHRRGDGSYADVLDRGCIARDERGRPRRVIGAITDVTDLRRVEARLREGEKRQRAFVAHLAHELRTPVSAIKGFAETLRRGALRDERRRGDFVRTIESHADRLAWIVDNLLSLSALEAGRALKLEPVEVKDEVAGYIASIATLTAAKRVRVVSTVPEGLRVLADRPHLLQALENLVGNAVKFNRPGGWVRVEASRMHGLVRLSVRDNGPGIAPSHLPRLFDRFFRGGDDRAPGAGLGLSLVRKIAVAHGGTVTVESRHGHGAAFHLHLRPA